MHVDQIPTLQKTDLQELHLEEKEGAEPMPSPKSVHLDPAQTWVLFWSVRLDPAQTRVLLWSVRLDHAQTWVLPWSMHLDSAQMQALLCLHLSRPAAAWTKVSNAPLIKRNIPYPGIDFQIHLLLISLRFNLIKLGSISNIDFNKILIKIRAIIKHNFSDHCGIPMDPTSKTNLLLV